MRRPLLAADKRRMNSPVAARACNCGVMRYCFDSLIRLLDMRWIRIGFTIESVGQIKIMQEVIT